MKLRMISVACGLLGSAGVVEAKTYVIYTDPMTLHRRLVVLDTPGPDRVLMCMAPPAEAGCTQVRAKFQR